MKNLLRLSFIIIINGVINKNQNTQTNLLVRDVMFLANSIHNLKEKTYSY